MAGELVRQALPESRLTIAGGGPAELYTPWVAGFGKQYPRRRREVQGAFSSGLVVGIDAELRPKVAGGAQAADASDLSQVMYRLAGRVTVGGQVSASPPRGAYQ